MPRYLYLMRHAQSAEKQNGQSDKDRVLTPLGVHQAVLIGKFLEQEKTSLDSVVCSVAERAKMTAKLVADTLPNSSPIDIVDELYEASLSSFIDLISQLKENIEHVLFVGHNPTITYVVESLTQSSVGDIRPAGMAIIECDIERWDVVKDKTARLMRLVHPEDLKIK
jgi:phosphohistidine phosphatase